MPFNIIIIKKVFLRRAAQKDRPDAAAGRPARLRDDEGGDLRAAASHNHGTEKRKREKKGMLLDQQRISLSLSGCAAPVLRSMKNLHSWLVVGGQDRRELRCDQLHAQAAGSLPLQQRRPAQAAVREDRLGGRDHVQRHRHPRIYIYIYICTWLLTFVLLSLLP